ncbi:MAG: response regulator transcription factor [Bacteroidales bacterium]|nr:response regulator transcription factor [Bacteroidales bacterium]
MNPLRCVIVDDEPLAVKLLEGFVARTPFLALAGSFTDPVAAMTAIRAERPELVFLDIQMPDLDGMELSRMIPPETKIVFTTAFKQYAFESYEVSALDFLLKPVRYQKFLAAAEKAREWFEGRRFLDSLRSLEMTGKALRSLEMTGKAQRSLEMTGKAQRSAEMADSEGIFLKAEGEYRKVRLEEIVCVEGMKDYVLVYLAGEKQPLVVHTTMKAMEELLPPQRFMRIHRSAIVALGQIRSVSPSGDIVAGDRFLHVSEGYRAAFDAYLEGHSLR